jgi:hypothetical protein
MYGIWISSQLQYFCFEIFPIKLVQGAAKEPDDFQKCIKEWNFILIYNLLLQN